MLKRCFHSFHSIILREKIEIDNNYRHKLWIDSLDHVNSNVVNMHSMLTEIESSMNTLGARQDQLITLANDYCLCNS